MVDAVYPKTGGTALHEAARLGQVLGAKYLLTSGADVEKRDGQGHTPLLAAAAGVGSKCGDMVRELIAAGARVDTVEDKTRNSPLHVASDLGNNDVVERLLRGGADLAGKNAVGQIPLHLAAGKGHQEVVSQLLRAGAEPNVQDRIGRTPLYIAAVHGKASVIGELARAGADMAAITLGGSAPLTAAAEEGQANVVKALLKLGIWVLGGRRVWADALCCSARQGYCDVLRQLLLAAGQGGLPGSKFIARTGTSPIHCAAAYGRLGATRMLLEAGADENILNGAGFYPKEVVGTRRRIGEENPQEDTRIAHMLKHGYIYKSNAWLWAVVVPRSASLGYSSRREKRGLYKDAFTTAAPSSGSPKRFSKRARAPFKVQLALFRHENSNVKRKLPLLAMVVCTMSKYASKS